MTIAEHKLYLFRQIDQMQEESLIELEKIIAKLSFKLDLQVFKFFTN